MASSLTFFEVTCQPLHVDELTTLGQEFFRSLSWDEDNPFVSEDYDCEFFMRFDGLVIKNSDEGGVTVGFVWKRTIICNLHIEGPRLQRDNDVLFLRGIESRQRVTGV